jgi:hypothetical protein
MYNKRILTSFLAIAVVGLLFPGISLAQLNITVNGTLGDLDGDGDGGAGEAAVVTAAVNCWSARVTQNRNFTLNIMGGPLAGGTIGQGRVLTVDGSNLPITGRVTMDNDGSTVYFVDPTPLTSTEWTVDDPASPWRLQNGTAVDLFSVFIHEVGHALAWLSQTGCGGTNPSFDALFNPPAGSFVPGPLCTPPFPTRGQPQLAGCVQLVGPGYNVSLRGDGLGGSGSCSCNELSHPGITGDLMIGFYGNNAREQPSVEDVDAFRVAYGDTVNLPPLVNAGNDIVSECNATGGSNVTLDGSGSTDPESNPLTYQWSCPGIILSTPNSVTSSGFFPLGSTTTCRLDATDVAACPADAEFVQVSVVDTTDPAITCPSDITIECDESTDPSNTGEATVSDTCDSAADISFSDVVSAGACPDESTITRTWTAIDGSGNSDSCVQVITIVDTEAPVISCNAPATIVPPDAPISFTATASDNCDPDPLVELTEFDCFMVTSKGKVIDKTESCVVSLDGDTVTILDSGGVGDQITWTVRATDRCGETQEVGCRVGVVNPAR